MAIETIGAKIRNKLSPYKILIEMAQDDRITDDQVLKYLRNPIHNKCCDLLIELSKECEIEPSDRWDKFGD